MCEDHFTVDSFMNNITKRLWRNAIPILFACNQNTERNHEREMIEMEQAQNAEKDIEEMQAIEKMPYLMT